MTASLTLYADGPPPDVASPGGRVALRAAARTDASALGALYFTAYELGVGAASADEAKADIVGTFDGSYGPLLPGASLVALAGEQLVGAVLVVERAIWPDVPDGPFVVELFTARAHRRRGVARALLERAMGEVAGSVALRVAADNQAALTLYESLGFRETGLPRGRGARLDVLLVGTLDPAVRSTCALIREDSLVAVVDPGLAPSHEAILGPLRRQGVSADDVNAVILSHHHPDHTVNAALFPNAAVHDHWAVYRGDDWESRECEGTTLSPSVRLIRTPGHSAEDLSVLVGTADGVVATTHLWWTAEGPADDPYAPDRETLRRSRRRVLALADGVVPGHGAPFRPSSVTPV